MRTATLLSAVAAVPLSLVLAGPALAQTAPCDAYSGGCPSPGATSFPGGGNGGGDGTGTGGGGGTGTGGGAGETDGGTGGGAGGTGGGTGAGTGAGTGGGTGGGTTATSGRTLPFTGGETVLLGLGGLGAVAAGSVLVAAGRRRGTSPAV